MLFRYSLTSHEGDWKKGGCRDFGWSFTNPLIAVQVEGRKDGRIEPASGFCTVAPAHVMLMTKPPPPSGSHNSNVPSVVSPPVGKSIEAKFGSSSPTEYSNPSTMGEFRTVGNHLLGVDV
jgi:hypothetical protein